MDFSVSLSSMQNLGINRPCPGIVIKQITGEPMEWQAALGLSEEHDLGERKKKDDPPQPQHHQSIKQHVSSGGRG